jgi:hypothetical protein
MIPKPLASAGRFVRSLVRKPGGSGVVMAAGIIPLIFLMPGIAGVIVVVALVVYPFVDTPRTLAGGSWWRAALVALPVWLIVFVVLTGLVETVRPMGAGAMVYLAPFMLYPFALAITGLVRLAYWLDLRPRASGPRTAAISVGIVGGLLIFGPVLLGVISMIRERVTGNTAPNTSLSREGEVVSAAPGRVDVRLSDGKVESFQFGQDTSFVFLGPGSPLVKGEAGPSWLTLGQKVGLSYVYRSHQATASNISIWIDRKGCAGDEQWLAAGRPDAPAQDAPSLVGSTWEGTVPVRYGPEPVETTTFEFLPNQRLVYQDKGGSRETGDHWRQNGSAVLIEINDCYAKYAGTITGDRIAGEFSNEVGARTAWTAHRK